MLEPASYLPRILDRQLASMLEVFGAVCIEGPKWCGKTWLSLKQAGSVTYLADPAGNFQNRRLAQMDPALVLTGKEPHLIDEWQEVPSIWDAVRFACDQRRDKGRFLLTGSSTPVKKGELHSGTGRIGKLALRTMSLFESQDSDGTVSLEQLLNNTLESGLCPAVTLEDITRVIVRGGWPDTIDARPDQAQKVALSYLENIPFDMERVDGKRRDSRKIMQLLRSLARNESTLASKATLKRDIFDEEDAAISDDSITDYLDMLARLFLTADQPAFNPNMRSSVRVGKTVKRHLTDPSLAAAALGANQKRLREDLNTLGFLFESLCERDLAIYASAINGKLRHYRDSLGREIDAVVEREDGSWGAFEIKLGANQIDDAAESLLKLAADMANSPKTKLPACLCVICGLTTANYTRPDGVMVVSPFSLRD